jgi:fumarate hydratase class II
MVAITVGGMQGHYELNVFKPVMAALLTISAIRRCLYVFDEHCAQGWTKLQTYYKLVDNSLMLVTALNTKIGYYKSAEIAQTLIKMEQL